MFEKKNVILCHNDEMIKILKENSKYKSIDKLSDKILNLRQKIWLGLYHAIKISYKKVPFHNFSHAVKVAINCMRILYEIGEKNLNKEKLGIPFDYSKLEELLFLAALLHDAGHGYYSTEEDEIKSAELAEKLLRKYGYSLKAINYVKKLVLATTFRDRKKINEKGDIFEKIIADADIARSVWGSFEDFIRKEINLFIEINKDWTNVDEKIWGLVKSKEWFMEFLKKAGWGEVFLLPETKKLFPYSKENLIKLQKMSPEELKKKFEEEWRRFYWYDFFWESPIMVVV